MTPIEFACSHTDADGTNCGAEAGEPCLWNGVRVIGDFHAERIEAAAAMSAPNAETPSAAEFDQAAAEKLFGDERL